MGPAAPGLTEDDLARVRAGYDSFNRQDIDALLALLDHGIEFHLPLDPLGEQPVFRGRDGARRFYETVFGGFEELRAEVHAVRPIGQVAAVTGRIHARTPGAAEPIVFGFAHFWTVRDGRAVSVAFHDADNPLRLLDEGAL
jgi:ketosteroid isomerase-like protein